MIIKLRLARIAVPSPIRKKKIAELANLTAEAFGRDSLAAQVRLKGLTPKECLREYARLTRDLTAELIESGENQQAVLGRLRRNAVLFGAGIMKEFGVRSRNDARALLRLAYRSIGIEMDIRPDGEIIVSRCYFRDFYGPETCRIISSIDEGLMAGILGEGNLEFSERLTEGHDRCRARFLPPGEAA